MPLAAMRTNGLVIIVVLSGAPVMAVTSWSRSTKMLSQVRRSPSRLAWGVNDGAGQSGTGTDGFARSNAHASRLVGEI